MQEPSINEFFPPSFWFKDTIFQMNRIVLVRLIATITICLVLFLLSRNLKIIPTKTQYAFEQVINFIYKGICVDNLGTDAGRRYFPYIASVFVTVFAMNITGIIPLLNIASTGVVAMPLIMALCSWVVFIFAGIRQNGFKRYITASLFPQGVPVVLYVLLTPIEFLSTFILRPLTLTIRLMANMISGHLLLGVFYIMTNYLLVECSFYLKPVAALSFLACFAFTLFEIFVAVLQAYIFALLSAVYISLSVQESH